MDKTVVHETARRLLSVYHDQAAAYDNALLLVEKITGRTRNDLIIAREINLSPEQYAELERVVDLMITQHMPLQYVLGSVPFLDVTIDIRPPILIPRPETEEWCGQLIEQLALLPALQKTQKNERPFTILDLCCGSGCIAIALARAFPQAHIIGVDIVPAAVQLARHNALKNDLTNCAFYVSDLFSGVTPGLVYDLIVSNPPYIAPEEFVNLEPEVRLWEDERALVAQDHGLALIRQIVHAAPAYLRMDNQCGQLWCEIGYAQGPMVRSLFEHSGFNHIEVWKDLAGNDRVVRGQL